MVTCPSCQGSIEEGSAACIHCGHIIKRRGWWRRFLDVFAGEKPAAGHAEAGTTHPSGQPSAMMSEQEEQSWQHLGAAQNLGYEENMAEAIAEYTIAISLSPNPPKDTDGRREGSGKGWVRELQGRWPGLLG